ncbi:MAG: DUF3369 domain-containing protein [Desulfuromonadaceae bacterium]|nr:DUF3369 domain-containing protein [Desulfuromonadaceae bacterium]MDD2855002.1 DUF3369 domain-containing protein [Desulfuromonadaceae bacterium]
MHSENIPDEELFFADELSVPRKADNRTWKIMIVDDEEEIHQVTRMALQDFTFENRNLTFINAYSGSEARRVLQDHPDVALILLDVIMETDHAGLDVVRHVREVMGNSFVRIILRTGRPGQTPEKKVITEYDINDYKEKTELTVQKLTTTIITALRSYRDLHIIDRNRQGLLKIIAASAQLFEIQSLKQFANGVLTQLLSILNFNESSLYLHAAGLTSSESHEDEFIIMAATGIYESLVDRCATHVMAEEIKERLAKAVMTQTSLFFPDAFVGYFPAGSGRTGLLYLSDGVEQMSDMDRELLRLFSSNVSIAFKNLDLNSEIIETQKEVIITLGEIVETRSHELVHHVKRVAEVSYLLAIKAGLSEEEAEIIRLASPMHDVGKVGVPDSILFSSERLNSEEFSQIKPHAVIGYKILKNSRRTIMEAAATIAHQHHERWDGKGYPHGISGENIHIYARIVGMADVFDALSHRRVYKEPWKSEDVVACFRNERGAHFDPRLLDIFLANFDEFQVVNLKYPVQEEK